MSARETLLQIVDGLCEERVVQLLHYANYLSWQEEQNAWREFGRRQLATAYGDDEPEYTTADLKKELGQ